MEKLDRSITVSTVITVWSKDTKTARKKRNSCKGKIVPVAQKNNRGDEFSKDFSAQR